jgi:hypothetical protein
VQLLPYTQFGRLRLRSYLPATIEITEDHRWEWMNGTWLYEGIGFTWFGRLETAPEETAGLEILFEEIPDDAAKRILAAIGLAVLPGMSFDQLTALLGPPQETEIFADDRKTHVFLIGSPNLYQVSCTVHETMNLIHVSIIREDVRRELEVA